MNKMHRTTQVMFNTGIILIIFFMFGCSTKIGNFAEKTHFSFPNSNIKPMGQVHASQSKMGFIIPPQITAEDVRGLINQALEQKPGADLVINYKTDTEIMVVPIPILSIYKLTMELSGTAVKMEVGRQELKELIKKTNY